MQIFLLDCNLVSFNPSYPCLMFRFRQETARKCQVVKCQDMNELSSFENCPSPPYAYDVRDGIFVVMECVEWG